MKVFSYHLYLQRLGHMFVWYGKNCKFYYPSCSLRLSRSLWGVFQWVSVCFARSPTPPGSQRILDMTECLQWARYRWQWLMGSTRRDDEERRYNYSSLLACGSVSSHAPKLAAKHRIVIPHLRPFKDEYEKFSGTYVNNRIRTTKYTLLNFVPRNLFEQFHRYFYSLFEKEDLTFFVILVDTRIFISIT